MRVSTFAFALLLLSNCVSTKLSDKSPVKTIGNIADFLPMQAKLQVVFTQTHQAQLINSLLKP